MRQAPSSKIELLEPVINQIARLLRFLGVDETDRPLLGCGAARMNSRISPRTPGDGLVMRRELLLDAAPKLLDLMPGKALNTGRPAIRQIDGIH